MSAEPARVECPTCLGYGHISEKGRPTVDRRGRKCLDCRGDGWVPHVLPSPPMRGGKQPGAGRPRRVPEGTSKPRPGPAMTDSEWAQVEAYAKAEGIRVTEAMRRLIAAGLGTRAIRRALAAAEEEG